MTLILECIVICFILLVLCVVAIADGVEQAAFLVSVKRHEKGPAQKQVHGNSIEISCQRGAGT